MSFVVQRSNNEGGRHLLPRASSLPSNPGDAGGLPTAPGFIASIEPWGCGEHSELPALGFSLNPGDGDSVDGIAGEGGV